MWHAYLMLGITITGQKECLGIWIGQNESSKFWLGLLNELRNRGVSDVLIFAVDGLTGFPEAIHAAYPEADVQRCIVHQIRNSLGQMSWKDRKAAAASLKSVYTAPTEEEGLKSLDLAAQEAGKRWTSSTRNWAIIRILPGENGAISPLTRMRIYTDIVTLSQG